MAAANVSLLRTDGSDHRQPLLLPERLRVAVGRGETDVAVQLIDNGILLEPDKDGRTLLHIAAQNGHVSIINALLLRGFDVSVRDKLGYTALHRAAAQGRVEIVEVLLKRKCPVNATDACGNTALHAAAWNGYSRTVNILINNEADANIVNKSMVPNTDIHAISAVDKVEENSSACRKKQAGCSALDVAAQKGHNQSARVLLYGGCSPDLRNKSGDTALHTASKFGHAGITRILISAKCKINVQNKEGNTALHVAVINQRLKIVKLLLEAGIKCKLKNKNGAAALDIAKKLPDGSDYVALIQSYKKSFKFSINKRKSLSDEFKAAAKCSSFSEDLSDVRSNRSECMVRSKSVQDRACSPCHSSSVTSAVAPSAQYSCDVAPLIASDATIRQLDEQDRRRHHISNVAPAVEKSSNLINSQLRCDMGPVELLSGFCRHRAQLAHKVQPVADRRTVRGLLCDYVERPGVQYYKDLAGNLKQGPSGYTPVDGETKAINGDDWNDTVFEDLDNVHVKQADYDDVYDKRSSKPIRHGSKSNKKVDRVNKACDDLQRKPVDPSITNGTRSRLPSADQFNKAVDKKPDSNCVLSNECQRDKYVGRWLRENGWGRSSMDRLQATDPFKNQPRDSIGRRSTAFAEKFSHLIPESPEYRHIAVERKGTGRAAGYAAGDSMPAVVRSRADDFQSLGRRKAGSQASFVYSNKVVDRKQKRISHGRHQSVDVDLSCYQADEPSPEYFQRARLQSPDDRYVPSFTGSHQVPAYRDADDMLCSPSGVSKYDLFQSPVIGRLDRYKSRSDETLSTRSNHKHSMHGSRRDVTRTSSARRGRRKNGGSSNKCHFDDSYLIASPRDDENDYDFLPSVVVASSQKAGTCVVESWDSPDLLSLPRNRYVWMSNSPSNVECNRRQMWGPVSSSPRCNSYSTPAQSNCGGGALETVLSLSDTSPSSQPPPAAPAASPVSTGLTSIALPPPHVVCQSSPSMQVPTSSSPVLLPVAECGSNPDSGYDGSKIYNGNKATATTKTTSTGKSTVHGSSSYRFNSSAESDQHQAHDTVEPSSFVVSTTDERSPQLVAAASSSSSSPDVNAMTAQNNNDYSVTATNSTIDRILFSPVRGSVLGSPSVSVSSCTAPASAIKLDTSSADVDQVAEDSASSSQESAFDTALSTPESGNSLRRSRLAVLDSSAFDEKVKTDVFQPFSKTCRRLDMMKCSGDDFSCDQESELNRTVISGENARQDCSGKLPVSDHIVKTMGTSPAVNFPANSRVFVGKSTMV